MSLRQELLAHVRQQLKEDGVDAEIQEGDSLIDAGLIDSMGLMQIMMFIEERTGIRVPDSEVTRENFDTVVEIENLIQRLREQKGG